MNISTISFQITNLALPVVLFIGPPGAGKTEVGKTIAQKLNWQFLDTDIVIEQATDLKIHEIFSRYGESTFRALEKNLVERLFKLYSDALMSGDNKNQGTVISCGGGLPMPTENFSMLSGMGKLVHLYASIDVLFTRATKVAYTRPLLQSSKSSIEDKREQRSKLTALVKERQPIYMRADQNIDTSNLDIDTLADQIIQSLKELKCEI